MEFAGGKYQVVRKLASGGMAEVYLARAAGPMGFEKTVVIKRILPHLADDQNFISMFLSEARLAALLNHPNVVQVFDFGQAEDTYYLVMEFIDGVNLRVLFRRATDQQAPLDFGLVARIISLACDGLAYAHDFTDPQTGAPMGLVHRDVSPDNILIARNGSVKVVDFGIAKAANQTHLTRTGTVKGKFSYMPPEQINAEVLDRRSDVFALGIVLFELLTGRKPFDTSNEAFIVRAILYEPLPPASQFRPGVPEALERILKRALAKNRDERYPDCRAMQADLERFILQTGEPISQYQLAQLVQSLTPAPAVPGVQTPGSNAQPIVKVPPPDTIAMATPGLDPEPAKTTPAPRPAPKPVGPGPTAETVRELGPVGGLEETRPAPLAKPAAAPRKSGLVVPIAAAVAIALGGVVALGLVKWQHASDTPVVVESTKPPEPTKPEPTRPEPTKPEPAQPEPTKPEPAQPEPAQPEPTKPEPTQPEPTKPEPTKPEPTKPEPTKPDVKKPVVKRPTPTPASKVQGQLEFRVRPFGVVYVDGKLLGETPFPAASLPVGSHQVRVVNKELGKEVTRTVEVKEGANTFRHNFEE